MQEKCGIALTGTGVSRILEHFEPVKEALADGFVMMISLALEENAEARLQC